MIGAASGMHSFCSCQDVRDDLASVGLVAEVRILGTCFVEICPKRKGS